MYSFFQMLLLFEMCMQTREKVSNRWPESADICTQGEAYAMNSAILLSKITFLRGIDLTLYFMKTSSQLSTDCKEMNWSGKSL